MSHTFSVKLLNLISCSPSPCTGRYPARTTAEAPLPCRIFKGLHLIAILLAFRFRQSPFACVVTAAWQIVGYDFRPFLLIADASWQVHATSSSRTGRRVSRYNEYEFPPFGIIQIATLRCRYNEIPLGLSFNQYRLYPLSVFSSYHSVAVW